MHNKHKDSGKHENKDHEHECNGCICDQLRKLQTQTEVDVFLSSGQVLEDVVFINFDRDNCCAFFSDPETEPGSTLIVDCQRIDAIRIEAD
ncbi:hydrolase [Pseudobacillus sp. FSL P4-0506]|uniref:hydrolase n=1 Tax=Pseudobacillus sp. FSL P4-0506 TaxID=2921576 RepID=UPI0030FC121A